MAHKCGVGWRQKSWLHSPHPPTLCRPHFLRDFWPFWPIWPLKTDRGCARGRGQDVRGAGPVGAVAQDLGPCTRLSNEYVN